jgi:hypothetical protein
MAKGKTEAVYEEIPEFLEIADKIIEKHPTQFGNIDLSTVACVVITNKERPEKKTQLWEIKSIKPPISLFSQKQYVFVFFKADWEEMNEERRAMITADALCSIPPEGNGDVVTMDYKDHSLMLRTFGVDYMESDKIPNLLEDDIEWKK